MPSLGNVAPPIYLQRTFTDPKNLMQKYLQRQKGLRTFSSEIYMYAIFWNAQHLIGNFFLPFSILQLMKTLPFIFIETEKGPVSGRASPYSPL